MVFFSFLQRPFARDSGLPRAQLFSNNTHVKPGVVRASYSTTEKWRSSRSFINIVEDLLRTVAATSSLAVWVRLCKVFCAVPCLSCWPMQPVGFVSSSDTHSSSKALFGIPPQ